MYLCTYTFYTLLNVRIAVRSGTILEGVVCSWLILSMPPILAIHQLFIAVVCYMGIYCRQSSILQSISEPFPYVYNGHFEVHFYYHHKLSEYTVVLVKIYGRWHCHNLNCNNIRDCSQIITGGKDGWFRISYQPNLGTHHTSKWFAISPQHSFGT